jgi:hypothetical protein
VAVTSSYLSSTGKLRKAWILGDNVISHHSVQQWINRKVVEGNNCYRRKVLNLFPSFHTEQATVSFTVCPSVLAEQLCSRWADFDQIFVIIILRNLKPAEPVGEE